MSHPAALYNKARHHAFSVVNKFGGCDIKGLIANEYGSLPYHSQLGLIAEVEFFKKYRKQYHLTPALDCGDKADFIGKINNDIARIDVTLNASFKNLADYDRPIEMSGDKYYLAVVDLTGEISEIILLNVPITNNYGGEGRLIDLAILRGPEYDKDGCSKYNPYQELIRVDTSDYSIKESKIVTDWYIEDFGTFQDNIPDDIEDEKVEQLIKLHGSDTARLLSKEYGYNVLGCLSHDYHTLTPDGDGDYGYYLRWIHPLFESLGFKLGDELPLDI